MTPLAYRWLRLAVGTASLGAALLAFCSVPNWLPTRALNVALWPQFTPSALKLIHHVTWLSSGALAVLLLTFLLGRVYCAMLCPLGVLMDLTAWLGRRSGKKRRLPYHTGYRWPRIAAVLVVLGGLALGSALPLSFLDPYSIFGKIATSTVRPMVGWANHALATIGVGSPTVLSPTHWASTGLSFALLAGIIAIVLWRGRLWCNTLCPVGAVLGWVSRHSLFRLRIAESSCVACARCETSCPAQCIDFRHYAIDHSRCVMCLHCASSCRRHGISWSFFWPWQRSPRSADPASQSPSQSAPSHSSQHNATSPSRRWFLTTAATSLPSLALAGQNNHRCRANRRPVLPPGAVSEEHFRSRCTACHLCVSHCPQQVLRPAISEAGLEGFLQPFQDFHQSFCSYNCSLCSQVCPTGAIQAVEVKQRQTIQTGVAAFFRGRCIVHSEGTSCGACSEHCPTQAVHMVPWKHGLTIPKVEPDLCVGCGACEFICPATPHKAIIVKALTTHAHATPIQRGSNNVIRPAEEDFPF